MRRSCLCRVWCGGVNWTIALNVFRLQIFCRRQSRVVADPVHTAEADTTQIGLFCRVWRGGVNWVQRSLVPVITMHYLQSRWLGSRVVSVIDSGAEGLGLNRSRDAVG